MEAPIDAPTQPLGYTIAGACQAIPCSRSFLYRQMKAGNIRFTRHGTKVLFSRQALAEFLGEDPALVGFGG
jgi:excisionase family DNA binding protein